LHDRLLSARSRTRPGAALGRIFGVTRQSWALTDDPRVTAPALETLATGRSAAEAADFARDAATAYASHGFHKPSGAWWGADAETFHRFLVRPGSRAPFAAVAAMTVAGVAAVALSRRWSKRRGKGASA